MRMEHRTPFGDSISSASGQPAASDLSMARVEEWKGMAVRLFPSTGAQRTLETADAARLNAPFFLVTRRDPHPRTLKGTILIRRICQAIRAMPSLQSQRFVITTRNQRRLEPVVGRTSVILIVGRPKDLRLLLKAVEAGAAAALIASLGRAHAGDQTGRCAQRHRRAMALRTRSH